MFAWWLAGVLVVLTAIGIVIPAAIIGGPVGGIIALLVVIAVLLSAYIRTYIIAWRSIPVSNLVDLDGTPASASVIPTETTANYLGGDDDDDRGAGERNARAFMIGMNAATTAAAATGFMLLDPLLGLGIVVLGLRDRQPGRRASAVDQPSISRSAGVDWLDLTHESDCLPGGPHRLFDQLADRPAVGNRLG
jgi:hypothetical protein